MSINIESLEIEPIEKDALRLLLAGDDAVLNVLREQMSHVQTAIREHTGVGAYVRFTLDKDAAPLPGDPSFAFGDVIASVAGLETGVGFLLFVQHGYVHMMEVYSYDEYYPIPVGNYSAKYMSGSVRDVHALHLVRGWPRFDT